MFFAALTTSCYSDPYVYDGTGYDAGARPVVAPNPNIIQRAPDSYYRQPQPYYPQQQNYYQAQPQPYYPQQQNYGQQQQYQPAPYNGAPGSRFYSNPYSVPQPSYYPNYDVDQYYVPPTNYNNVEPEQKQSNSQGKY